MKAEKTYQVDKDVLESFESTVKSLDKMKPKDRLEYHFHTVEMLTDIIQQCKHVGQVLSMDDRMVSMTEKDYNQLFEEIRDIDTAFAKFNISFTKRVPTLTEEAKAKRNSKPSPQLIT